MKQGWEIKKLGEIALFRSGYTPKDTELLKWGDIPYYKVSDMNHPNNTRYLKDTRLFLEKGCKTFSKYSIVFPKNGAAIATNKKRILWQDSVVDLNTGVVEVIDSSQIRFEYLYQYIQHLDFRIYTRRGAVPTLDIKELKKLSISIPPIAEQEKIVAELDCLSSIIEKKKQQLKELDNLAQSIFYEMFGDPIENRKGWQIHQLGDVCNIICGQDYKSVKDDNGQYPIYGTGGVMGYASQYRCPEHSIIIGRKGNINTPLYVDCKFWNVDTAFGVVPNRDTLIPKYFFFFCKNYDFTRHDVSVTIPSLRRADIIKIDVPIPPLALQQDFASKIEAIEKQKELIAQSIKETETLFNSRMDYYFN